MLPHRVDLLSVLKENRKEVDSTESCADEKVNFS